MPKIRAFTPAWLSTDAPDGRGLFRPTPLGARNPALAASTTASPRLSVYGSPKKNPAAAPGPRRTIAQRGTEVFVANGKEIRWANLASVKAAWDAARDGGFAGGSPAYRTLKPPVASDIRQLVLSPHANYMAILTTHTVHICVLPDSSHLAAATHDDPDVPLKARYFTLGPTTHVTTRAPVVAALWHPLGVHGAALATVTRDAVVRLWEVSPVDRWSFDAPSLAIDVKKLADGTWLDQDFGASATTNTAYSPDLFDMEVAAACFGPRSAGGWSSMTLYIAMLGGDVYALCPLLPKRFAPPPALIPSLSVAVVSNLAALEDDASVSPRAKQLARQQVDWMSQIDNQEPTILAEPATGKTGLPAAEIEIYTRPSHPSIVPRLQGPLEVDLGDDDESDSDDGGDGAKIGDLCDILVIGEKVDTAVLAGEDDEYDEPGYLGGGGDAADLIDDVDQEGLSMPVICLVTTTGRIHVCLDLVGVEAAWLPPRGHKSSLSSAGSGGGSVPLSSSLSSLASSARPLPSFQVVDVVREAEKRPGGWCTFSPDVTSRYAFFVTHPGGITHISLASWVVRLEQELQETTDTGADFRVRQLVTGENTVRQRVYTHGRDEPLATCTVLLDPDLGYFLLSATEHVPVAICFEAPETDEEGSGGAEDATPDPAAAAAVSAAGEAAGAAVGAAAEPAAAADEDPAVHALDFWKARPAFEVPPELLAPSELAQAKSMLFSSRYQMLQHQEVRLSPATLAILTNTHKLVSKETGRLNQGVAQIFTQLQDLPLHLREQVESAAALKRRIDMIAGEDEAGEAGSGGDDVRLRQRLEQAQARHKELSERMERLRRTFGRAAARPLSDKERVWAQEVQALETSLQTGDAAEGGAGKKASRKNGVSSSSSSSLLSSSVSAVAPASPAKSARDVGRRVQQVRALWADLAQQAEKLVPPSPSPPPPAPLSSSSSEDMKSSTASLVSVHSGGAGTPLAATTTTTKTTSAAAAAHPVLRVPADVRKAKMAQVTKLLERETAMVEAVTQRLERLGVPAT